MSVTTRLMAALGIDTSQYDRGLDGAKVKATEFERSFGKIGASIGGALTAGISAGAVIGFGKRAMETAVQIEHLSKTSGLTAEQVQTLSDAIEEAGGNAEALGPATTKIRDAQGQVIAGNKGVIESLQRAGIAASAFAGASMSDALLMIAKAGERASWQGEAFSAVADLLGTKAIPQLQLALSKLATDGWGRMTEEMRQSGEMMSNQLVKDLADSQREIQHWCDVTTTIIGTALAGWRREFSGQGKGIITSGIRSMFGLDNVQDVVELTKQDTDRMARAAKRDSDRAAAQAAPRDKIDVEAMRKEREAIDAEREKRADMLRTDEERLAKLRERRASLTNALDIEKAITEETKLQQRIADQQADERERRAKERIAEEDRAAKAEEQQLERLRQGVLDLQEARERKALNDLESRRGIWERVGDFNRDRMPESERLGGTIGRNRQFGVAGIASQELNKIKDAIDTSNRLLETIAGER